MIRFSEMSRGKIAGLLLAAVVFVVGALTILQLLGAFTSDLAKGVMSSGQQASNKPDSVTTIDNASFAYLVPGKSQDWKFDDKQTAFDSGKGIVKYVVTFTNAKVDATITEQQMPEQLKPRGSRRFEAFIADAKPTRSQNAGMGKLYFLPALKNGAPANGSDTVIYATDSILMFGRSDSVLGYDAWSNMLATMKPVAK